MTAPSDPTGSIPDPATPPAVPPPSAAAPPLAAPGPPSPGWAGAPPTLPQGPAPNFQPPQNSPFAVPPQPLNPGTNPLAPVAAPGAPTANRPRQGLLWLIIAVVIALIASGGFFAVWLFQAPSGGATSAPTGSALPVVTVTPTPLPDTEARLDAGGDLGQVVRITKGRTQLGTITVTQALWTNQGSAAPVAEQQYLILDVELTSATKALRIDPTLFVVPVDGVNQLPAFGPALERPLAGQVLAKGERASGQIGFMLPSRAVTLVLLDSNLDELGQVQIPAP